MDYKKKFPIFIEHDVHYLDTAATSQKPQEVIDSIVEYYENYNGNPGRGSHALSIESKIFWAFIIWEFISFMSASTLVFSSLTSNSVSFAFFLV